MQWLPGSDEPGAWRWGGLPGAAGFGRLHVQQCLLTLLRQQPDMDWAGGCAHLQTPANI